MLSPQRLQRLLIEVIFVFLGILVVWLGVRKKIFVDRHSIGWLVLGVALVLWGARSIFSPGQWWAKWENWTRGISLVLLGALMMAIIRVPFLWVGPLLISCGVLLAVRGIVQTILIARER
jgi:hypothetical protein